MVEPAFLVLSGTDYAGKSVVMRALAAEEPAWRLLSVDDEFLSPEHGVVSRLKSDLFKETLPDMGKHHSPDFVAGLLQTAVLHLRDQVIAASPHETVIVDSYYYKILAKCRLVGAAESIFAWWRGFPRPRRVVFLDVDPAEAWRRSESGARANRLEFHGEHVDRDPFLSFQTELRALMLEEVAHLPVETVPQGDLATTVRRVREAVLREHG
ncbi:MAG: hypothetical protein HOV94_08190 [Saccharothrix sp.]|nr:hypothetical protein [Saccharothrix sp.]